MDINPNKVWNDYQKIVTYLTTNNVYEEVKQNENFYEGKHWEGLTSENLPTPVINVLGRSCKFLVASLASNEIAVSMTPYSVVPDDKNRMKAVSDELEQIIETARIKESTRLAIRNACVDGTGFMMQRFEPDIETGQDVKGQIVNEVIDNTNVYYGNPYSSNTQNQPYIIIALRQYVKQVQKEAKELGVKEEDIQEIKPDNDGQLVNDDSDNLATVLIYYFKKRNKDGKKTVWFTKCTKSITLIEPTDLGYSRYPISYLPWEKRKNSYLGVSPMTSVIENQKFINKTFAVAMMYALQSAFPKIVYDKNKVNIDAFLNGISPNAIGSMDIMGKFLDFIKVPDFSNNVIDLAKETIAQTKDTLGVTDVSLGNVKAENTSAIIALQEASAVPLEIQKQNFYEFWEDTVRNILDIISVTYGKRLVMSDELGLAEVDFSVLKDMNYRLRVEIGAGAQYSEIAQINTLDKYLQAGLLPGSVHAKLIPSKYILGKDELVNAMREREQAMNPVPEIGQRMLDGEGVL